MMLINRH